VGGGTTGCTALESPKKGNVNQEAHFTAKKGRYPLPVSISENNLKKKKRGAKSG